MNKMIGEVSIKKIFLMLALAVGLTCNVAFASDNVLQAIQVNGVKDSYDVVLKSDDVAQVQKTVQAPNKIILTLKGITASKSINTIYNNTSNVDSVVVEPNGDDGVKISMQAENASNAQVHFDSLKTPLGVLGNNGGQQSKPQDQIVLSDPVNSYRPVYDNGDDEDNNTVFEGVVGSLGKGVKSAVKDPSTSWMITLGLFGLLMVLGVKLVKGKDNEIKVGLSQSLKEREVDMYKQSAGAPLTQELPTPQIPSASSFGLRAYQQGARNPYVSSEIQQPRRTVNVPQPTKTPSLQAAGVAARQSAQMLNPSAQKMASSSALRASATASKPKTANIDSMKFLESMTKIYEKNGRADLAQGLKSNMRKAKMKI